MNKVILCCSCCNSLWVTITICLFSLLIILAICSFVESIFKDKYELQKKLKVLQNEHEKSMRADSFQREKEMFDIEKERKNDDLERKISEFRELTIQQKLLDKVIEKELAQDIKDLQSEVNNLKADLEKAKVEISGYVLKKEE